MKYTNRISLLLLLLLIHTSILSCDRKPNTADNPQADATSSDSSGNATSGTGTSTSGAKGTVSPPPNPVIAVTDDMLEAVKDPKLTGLKNLLEEIKNGNNPDPDAGLPIPDGGGLTIPPIVLVVELLSTSNPQKKDKKALFKIIDKLVQQGATLDVSLNAFGRAGVPLLTYLVVKGQKADLALLTFFLKNYRDNFDHTKKDTWQKTAYGWLEEYCSKATTKTPEREAMLKAYNEAGIHSN